MFISFGVTSFSLARIKGIEFTFEHIIKLYSSDPYLAVYGEIASGDYLFSSLSYVEMVSQCMVLGEKGMLDSLRLSLIFAIVVLSLRTMQGG